MLKKLSAKSKLINNLLISPVFILALFFSLTAPNKAYASNYCVDRDARPQVQYENKTACEGAGLIWRGPGTTYDVSDQGGVFESLFKWALSYVMQSIMSVAALLTGITGAMLNMAVKFTIVDANTRYSGLESILQTWKVIRDLANISFIFVLLYAGIMTIVGKGGDYKRLIVNIVIAAVLMNFSLFFTRLVIDAGNLLALTFYEGIVGAGASTTNFGLSGAFVNKLHLQDLYALRGSITSGGILTIGFMGTIMLIIAAFSFAAVALLLIIRYIVLLLVLIFSPIFFLSNIFPGNIGGTVKKWGDQWKNALFGQTFFAPIYFLMTWVALKILDGALPALGIDSSTINYSSVAKAGAEAGAGGSASISADAGSVFINFAIVIILMITALIVAKDQADRAGGGLNKLTSWAMGKAGGATFGMAGRLGRTTIGRLGDRIADSKSLKDAEARGGIGGMAARLALASSRKTANASFDVRGNGVLGGALGQVGAGRAGLGFADARAKAIKEREERAENMKSEVTHAEIEAEMNNRYGANWRKDPAFNSTQKIEAARRQVQAQLKAQADRESLARQQEFINSMSESNGFIPGSGADREAAIKLRGSKGTAMQNMARLNNLEQGVMTASQTQNNQTGFEEALKKASDKEVEAIVESNRELLERVDFANALSAKQLEALTKSDKFSEEEKAQLKSSRFDAIIKAMDTANGGKGADSVKKNIKGLTDAEIEMLADIDDSLLSDPSFVGQMKQPQFDGVIKSNRFTNTQKDEIRTARRKPLIDAINYLDKSRAQALYRKLDAKTMASYMAVDGRKLNPTRDPNFIKVAMDPKILPVYTPKMLKNMSGDMTPEDIQSLRTALEKYGNEKTKEWLKKDDGGMVDFN